MSQRLRCLTRVRQPARLHYLTRMHDGWGLQRVGPEEEIINGGSRAEGGVGGQDFSRGEQVLGD